MNFKNKNVLITGSSRGLGAELARQIADKGGLVILSSEERTKDELHENTKQIQENGGEADCFVMDVTDGEMITNVFEKIKEKYGHIDVLINNAGILNDKCFHNGTIDEFDFMCDVNVKGYMRVAQTFMPILGRVPEDKKDKNGSSKNKEGMIVCVGSMAGEICVPLMQYYSITKAAAQMVAKALREHFIHQEQKNMKVLEINPMQFESNLYSHDELSGKFAKTMKKRGMMPKTEEIAEQIIEAAEKEKQEVFIPTLAKFTEYLFRLFPKLTTKLVRKQLSVE